MIRAYHFLSDNGTLRDGRPAPEDNVWLRHEGPISMCNSGLHASKRALDALKYAPGALLCRVALRNDIQQGTDKLVSRERKILWRIDATALLRAFARHCALQVIDKWEPPVVLEWLLTGNPSLQSAAYSAAAQSAARWAAYWAAYRAAYWAARWTAYSTARSVQNDTLEEFIKEARQGTTEWEFTL